MQTHIVSQGLILEEKVAEADGRQRRSKSPKGSSKSIALLIGLSWSWLRRIQTPLGIQRLFNLLGLGKLEVAALLRNNRALVLRLQSGDQLGL